LSGAYYQLWVLRKNGVRPLSPLFPAESIGGGSIDEEGQAMSAGIDWTTVSVALITAVSAAGGPFWIWHRQAARERESVRAALMAEVLALVELVELRGYLDGLRDAQAYLSPPGGASVTEIFEPRFLQYSVNIHEHYNRVFRQTLRGSVG
jgi:hypothetical protein